MLRFSEGSLKFHSNEQKAFFTELNSFKILFLRWLPAYSLHEIQINLVNCIIFSFDQTLITF